MRTFLLALVLATGTFVVLNLNGREIGGVDSQPTKYAAREMALRGTLTLDRVVASVPLLAERPAFARANDGAFRSAYPVAPSILAAGTATVMSAAGILDLDAPLAPTVTAKVTASLLVSLAVVFAFLIARQRASDGVALVVAIGYGLGTGLWPVASQTLGGHDTVSFALTGALVFLANPSGAPAGWRAWLAMALLALAGAARVQVAPAIVVLLIFFMARSGSPRRWLPVGVVAATALVVVAFNMKWFGHPLGAVPRLEALHSSVHDTAGTFSAPWAGGAAGLLFSPSRGLIVFSPIVLLALGALNHAWREGRQGAIGWCLVAAFAQFLFYASYAVWWAGHSYGPRYCLDLLPLLLPAAAVAASMVSKLRVGRVVACVALAWSVLLAGTGAFCYPADRWNTDPTEVDRDHARLWDWNDPQFVRCWKRGLSPQNFDLFSAEAFRRDAAPR